MSTQPLTSLPSIAPTDTKFDRKLAEILRHATAVFCEKGFAAASIRDISKASGTSLAGLYYYFESKDHLLYLIQKRAFSSLMAGLEERLSSAKTPEESIHVIVENAMHHFVGNPKEAKVLSHESDMLAGPYQAEIALLKRKYYRQCLEVMDRFKSERRLDNLNSRLAVLSLFGMMNWIYTWYNPSVDGDWQEIADQMSSIFLNGVLAGSTTVRPARKLSDSKQ